MSIFKEVRSGLLRNKEKRENGKDLVIPLTRFKKLSTVIPGVQRARYYNITSGPKGAKTQWCDTMFVLEPIDYLLANKDTNIKLEIHYFSLEMSKEDKIKQLISNKLYRDKNVLIAPEVLDSLYQHYVLDDEIATFLFDDDINEWFEFIESHVTYISNIKNPTGIYKYMREVARKNGKFFKDGKEVVIPADANWAEAKYSYDSYVPDDEDKFIICITDHVGLLSQESGLTELKDIIHKYSSDYCLKMRDNFKFTIVNVQQQALDSEEVEYSQGKPIISKVKPKHNKLGDSRTPSRDVDMIFGLFNPFRFNIDIYPPKVGFEIIDQLRDNYRELSIILNRRGGGSIELDLYFDGRVNFFEELPDPKEFGKLFHQKKTRLQLDKLKEVK